MLSQCANAMRGCAHTCRVVKALKFAFPEVRSLKSNQCASKQARARTNTQTPHAALRKQEQRGRRVTLATPPCNKRQSFLREQTIKMLQAAASTEVFNVAKGAPQVILKMCGQKACLGIGGVNISRRCCAAESVTFTDDEAEADGARLGGICSQISIRRQ